MPQGLLDTAIAADRAGIEAIVVPDGIAPAKGGDGWPDALIMIGWLAPQTNRIKLYSQVSSLGHQPYNLSRRLASLDLLSRGRAGWVVADDGVDDAFAAFSGPMRLEGVDLAARQAEFEHVVEALWQSWDSDALLLDKENARFFRPDGMHILAHEGEHFSVRGPLNVMRSSRATPDILHQRDLADAQTVASAEAALDLLGGVR
jgi:alkanesulfonate monooxygenase SsuD/methylene tetrahydromethanopterin reductase-like flavin-dependent oxidoreductase (luciferase family)